jgi:hypothetical protein
MEYPEHSVSRGVRLGTDDCELLARKRIQQCRFAGVGATDDGDEARAEGHF